MDFVFWQSAIYSRQAMRLNHTSAHKYADRKALGVFRIVAAVLTLSLWVFLTIYDLMVTNYRPWLMMNWWVCFLTFLFFAASLVPASNYFSEKEPNPRTAPDGSTPFYSWKFVASLWSFSFQAAIHLVVLENMEPVRNQEAFNEVVAFLPVSILACDFFANRIYLPLTVNFNYAYACYALAGLAHFLVPELEKMVKLTELRYFEVYPSSWAWALPAVIMVGNYVLMRIKFWYVDEGDIVFNFNLWAKEANDRMDWIEGDYDRQDNADQEYIDFKLHYSDESAKDPDQRADLTNKQKEAVKNYQAEKSEFHKNQAHKRTAGRSKRARMFND